MTKSSFADYVVDDLLGDMEGVRAKAMFGGYGVYKNDTIFAIIADEELYYKVDDSNRRDYEKYGSEPFQYTSKDKKKVTMSYWKLPSEVMDDRDALRYDEANDQAQTFRPERPNAVGLVGLLSHVFF